MVFVGESFFPQLCLYFWIASFLAMNGNQNLQRFIVYDCGMFDFEKEFGC